MRFSQAFIDRPIFATVLSILIVLMGAASYFTLPVAQYPEIAPPTVVVRAAYPGASAEVVAETVATPLEQEINGVEDMLYMSSQSTGDGQLALTVTFRLGIDLDTAQVLVQNRVAIAEPRLPEEVRRIGVTVRKNSPDLMMVVHVLSPDASRDQLYLSNYVTLQLRDRLARIDGVGDVRLFGARDYSMRVWIVWPLLVGTLFSADPVLAAEQGKSVYLLGFSASRLLGFSASRRLGVDGGRAFRSYNPFGLTLAGRCAEGPLSLCWAGTLALAANDRSPI